MKDEFQKKLEYIIAVIEEAGYNPFEQLYAYLHTGNVNYITRKGDPVLLQENVHRLYV